MINRSGAIRLAQYKAWADELMYDAVGKLPENEVHRPRETVFKSMIGTLNHNIVVDLIWQAHLLGRDHGFNSRAVMLHPSLPEARAAQKEINDWLKQWAAQQSDESLEARVRFKFISGEAAELSAGEVFLHLVNHASYHRGWVAEMFFAIPAVPPTTDLPVFLLSHPNPAHA